MTDRNETTATIARVCLAVFGLVTLICLVMTAYHAIIGKLAATLASGAGVFLFAWCCLWASRIEDAATTEKRP